MISNIKKNLAESLRRRRKKRKEKKRIIQQLLEGVRPLSMSQVGQDFWVYGEVFNEKREGFYLDIGAHDGDYLSNTFLLEKNYGWDGICVEGNPVTYKELIKNRSSRCINKCLDKEYGKVSFALRGVDGGIVDDGCDNRSANNTDLVEVDTMPLADLLIQEDAPHSIDYLSIDIEGAEERVLIDFPFDSYVFKCITIERPSTILRNTLVGAGYLLIKEIPGLDCFYIHSSFKEEYLRNTFDFGSKRYLILQK